MAVAATNNVESGVSAPRTAGSSAWLLAASLLLLCDVCLASGLDPPKSEGGYDKTFFDQHRKNAAEYIPLVQVLSEFVLQATGSPLAEVSILDVGCGHGLLVEAWRNAGVPNSFCIEGSSEASHIWPPQHSQEFYVVQDLEAATAHASVQPTDVVTTFEVAEHIRPEEAGHFVELLTLHHPRLVFFGAATPFQDRGKNPSHVNENTFEFWIEKFDSRGYHVDWTKTAKAKHALMTLPNRGFSHMTAWWYPKNLLIFAPDKVRAQSDRALLAHPAGANMLAPVYLNAYNTMGGVEFAKMWKRDWTAFGELFYEAQREANGGDEDGDDGGEDDEGDGGDEDEDDESESNIDTSHRLNDLTENTTNILESMADEMETMKDRLSSLEDQNKRLMGANAALVAAMKAVVVGAGQ